MTKIATHFIEKSDNAYRSIGEVADALDVPPHVLRYWESQFNTYIKPRRHNDGRRLFRPDDIKVFYAIYALINEQGVTVKRAQKLLSEHGVDAILASATRKAYPCRPANETGRQAITAKSSADKSPVQVPGPDDDKITHVGMESCGDARVYNGLQAVLTQMQTLKARIDHVRRHKPS